MKILSLNTWHGELVDEITLFIEKQAGEVDIFCFQEMGPKMREITAGILEEYEEFKLHKNNAPEDTFYQSVFIKKDLRVVASGSAMRDTPGTGLDLWVELETFEGNILISNFHGLSQPGDKKDTPERLQASRQIIDFVSGYGVPAVVIGDFNLSNDTKSVELFTEHDFVDLIKEHNVTNTRNKYAWERFPDNQQYYADYAFVTKDIKVNKFIVLPDVVSDHLPLLLEFEI